MLVQAGLSGICPLGGDLYTYFGGSKWKLSN